MDVEISSIDAQPQTPATSDAESKYRSTEDSGYHTPFTASLSDSGAFNSSSIKHISFRRNPISANRRKLVRSKAITSFGSFEENDATPATQAFSSQFHSSPVQGESSRASLLRRPLKRTLDQSENGELDIGVNYTPTSTITCDLERLRVQSPAPRPAPDLGSSDYFSLSSIGETSRPLSYPTTPVKSSRCKIAKLSPKCERKSSTKRSPSREFKENIYPVKRSVKKLSYDRPSLGADLQKYELRPQAIIPDKKIDIVGMLQERRVPAVEAILRYLDAVDLYNFSEVSASWRHICNSDKRAKSLKDNYSSFIRETKENCSSRKKEREAHSRVERASCDGEKLKLRCIHNFTNSVQTLRTADRTPPGTPRTNKLRKFLKCGSLDERTQLSCVRCCHPAKVTVELTGEQWAQCLSSSCAFAFCRFCKCEHHPGKTCHSLDAPSPTKRRKHSADKHFDSKKCRRNLRRLLER